MSDDLQDINAKARRLLEFLHARAIKTGGRPFFVSPEDPETAAKTGLDREDYRRAAAWLTRKHLAKPMGAGGRLTITDKGIGVAGSDAALDRELPGARTERTEGTSMSGPSMFISHATADAKLAKALISLIEAGLEVPSGSIRCTSVEGYTLQGGDDGPEVLRENLKGCAVVLGLLTKTSISSSYVQMELGAAWAFKKRAIPLIGPGATFADLPGPFKDIHALKLADEAAMSGLLKTLARETRLSETGNMPKVIAALKGLLEIIAVTGASEAAPPATFRAVSDS